MTLHRLLGLLLDICEAIVIVSIVLFLEWGIKEIEKNLKK